MTIQVATSVTDLLLTIAYVSAGLHFVFFQLDQRVTPMTLAQAKARNT